MTDQVYDRGPAWWTHSMPCDPKATRELFINKFGYAPEKVETEYKFLYLGPVVVSEDTND